MAGESDLERKIKEFAEIGGCYVRKFTSHHTAVPDRIISKGRVTLFLEVKDFGKVPGLAQQDEISIIYNTGGFATWVDSHEDAVEVIKHVIHDRPDLLEKQCKKRNFWAR